MGPLIPAQLPQDLHAGPHVHPALTCLAAVDAFFWASAVLCLRPSCRSRGVIGRGKQLVAFFDCRTEGTVR